MGRDIAGLRIDKKTSSVHVNGAMHAEPGDEPETVETKELTPEVHTAQPKHMGTITIHQHQEEKNLVDEAQTSTENMLISQENPSAGSIANEVETSDSGIKCSSKSDDLHSPGTAKKSQPNFPPVSRKHMHSKYYDDDDNLSVASSTATSRTTKSQVTVPVAPSFVCSDRAERRKEFYAKLDEKHKALEQEKLEYEARTKEEELAAIKQLRKSMTYKANPIPSFYSEGPPPKVELKKLPVTRAKSPNLSRRKSCGDAAKSFQAEKGVSAQPTRRSVGAKREVKNSPITPKSNDRVGQSKSNGTGKTKDRQQPPKEREENSIVKDLGSDDVSVES